MAHNRYRDSVVTTKLIAKEIDDIFSASRVSTQALKLR